jgi:hypothetical protein
MTLRRDKHDIRVKLVARSRSGVIFSRRWLQNAEGGVGLLDAGVGMIGQGESRGPVEANVVSR